jgi:hypothetical protein
MLPAAISQHRVQVFGDGPVELVFVGPMVSHVELFWTLPEFWRSWPRESCGRRSRS